MRKLSLAQQRVVDWLREDTTRWIIHDPQSYHHQTIWDGNREWDDKNNKFTGFLEYFHLPTFEVLRDGGILTPKPDGRVNKWGKPLEFILNG